MTKQAFILIGTIMLMFSLISHAQNNEIEQWYTKLAENHAKKSSVTKQLVDVVYTNGKVTSVTGEYLVSGKVGFCAVIGQKNIIMTSDLFLSVDNESKMILFKNNENEESLKSRIGQLMDAWFQQMLDIIEKGDGECKLEKKENDLMVISIVLPERKKSPYEKLELIFNKKSLEIQTYKAWYKQPESKSVYIQDIPEYMKISYEYLTKEQANIPCELSEFINISKDQVSTKSQYSSYQFINLSNRTYIHGTK
jgi:hypothetical protein